MHAWVSDTPGPSSGDFAHPCAPPAREAGLPSPYLRESAALAGLCCTCQVASEGVARPPPWPVSGQLVCRGCLFWWPHARAEVTGRGRRWEAARGTAPSRPELRQQTAVGAPAVCEFGGFTFRGHGAAQCIFKFFTLKMKILTLLPQTLIPKFTCKLPKFPAMFSKLRTETDLILCQIFLSICC